MADPAVSGADAAPLDEVMLAMDVVDTLRHRQHVVDRELNEEVREASLLKRLKDIYAAQGIDVPDRILKEGVENLKRSRFTYEPPPPGLPTTLARLYVARGRWGRVLGLGLVGLFAAWAIYTYGVRQPAERAAEAARIELAEAIPERIGALAGEIDAMARGTGPREQAEALRAEGIAAAAAGERERALAAERGLVQLRDILALRYDIRVVQGAGEQSGVWRVPDVNQTAENYYLIVEAIGPDGARLSVPIRSEESGETRAVTRWGQRVTSAAFDRVRRDKSDDGIVQNAVIGTKARGELEPRFTIAAEPGAILEW